MSLRDWFFKSLKLGAGARVNLISTDSTMTADSDVQLSTMKAIKAAIAAAGGSVVNVSGTFDDGDLDGSNDFIITRGTPGAKLPSSVMFYDENDVWQGVTFTPTSTTVTKFHMDDYVVEDGGTLTGTWSYEVQFSS